MAEESTEAAVAGADMGSLPNSEPHEMRITDHGKIHSFVSFGLKFLQENPQRPLVLHTFPFAKDSSVPRQNPETQARKIAKPTASIPRLVSVVEIIKREYAKWASTREAADEGPVDDSWRLGLHQYNELAALEDIGIVELQEPAPDDAEQLRQALEGKNFLKLKFTPHLKVTLSVSTQPQLEEKGATHQPPPPIKRSKSARARERKRQKKREARGEDS
ncbi:hypothetical protein JB92DRAFT_2902653, partial [Gautieria morchelliformis]